MGAKKMSLHQTGFQEVLSLAQLTTEKYPAQVLLIGCQPQELEDYGGNLRPSGEGRAGRRGGAGRGARLRPGVASPPSAQPRWVAAKP